MLQGSTPERSIVKIYTTALEYDFKSPWKAPTIEKWTGSGFVIDGKKIITNAHVAGGATMIEVQLANDSEKYIAKLIAIGHGCDLAMLEVDNPEFWRKAIALKIGETPQQKDEIEVHGFPRGGENYCITNGIVSRMENDKYVHGGQVLLSTQVSAAINPGNSGGPVINKVTGEVVGVVHQGISNSQNIGYMIPASVLKHFINQGKVKVFGFPTLNLDIQTMENADLRAHFGMRSNQTGVLIQDVPESSSAKDIIRPKDILLSINKIPVANDGSIKIGTVKHVDFRYLINNAKLGDEIHFELLRDGKKQRATVKLTNLLGLTHIVKPRTFGEPPTYFIIDGMVVVQPVSKNFITDTGRSYTNRVKESADEELVAINTLLNCEFTHGYEGFDGALIAKVNGKEIKNLKDLIEAINNHHGKTNVIETRSGRLLVVQRLSLAQSQKILDTYQIPAAFSKDLASLMPEKKEEAVAERAQAFAQPLVFTYRRKKPGAKQTVVAPPSEQKTRMAMHF